jgi:hypothetical protein
MYCNINQQIIFFNEFVLCTCWKLEQSILVMGPISPGVSVLEFTVRSKSQVSWCCIERLNFIKRHCWFFNCNLSFEFSGPSGKLTPRWHKYTNDPNKIMKELIYTSCMIKYVVTNTVIQIL